MKIMFTYRINSLFEATSDSGDVLIVDLRSSLKNK